MIRAEVFQALDFVGAGRARDDFRAELFGEQHAAGAYAAACAQHQYLVAFFDGVVGDNHAVCRAVGHRQRRGLLERHVVRHGDQLIGGDQAFFGEAAVHHFAHQALFLVQRIDQHAVTFFPASDSRADFKNFTGDIEANNHRKRHLDARHAAHGEHVVIVERGRADADHHMAFDHNGVGEIRHDLQFVEAAVLMQNNCFHWVAPRDFLRAHQRAC